MKLIPRSIENYLRRRRQESACADMLTLEEKSARIEAEIKFRERVKTASMQFFAETADIHGELAAARVRLEIAKKIIFGP